jgi:hypothetical protein
VRERILRRLRGLLAVAADAGATGPERSTAQALADRIVAKYDVRAAELQPVRRPVMIPAGVSFTFGPGANVSMEFGFAGGL